MSCSNSNLVTYSLHYESDILLNLYKNFGKSIKCFASISYFQTFHYHCFILTNIRLLAVNFVTARLGIYHSFPGPENGTINQENQTVFST